MNFAFSEEQEELRKTVRSFLEAKSPETEVRKLMETAEGYDSAIWNQMGAEMGLQGLVIPEEYGGSGYSYVELGVVLEEMGRALLCAPFFSTVALAANTLLQSGDDAAKKAYLPGIASGETIATLAFTEPSGKWDEAGITMQATGSGSDWKLSGTKSFVLDGHTASLILVAARTGKGVSLFAVDGGASGLTRTALSTMDQTRKQAKLEFANTPAKLVGTEGAGWAVLSKVLDLAAVALAAEQVGGAQKVLEMAVEYAKVRVQFGRPIGSFQAIKHKCADMLLLVESARSAAYYAACVAAEGGEGLAVAASLASAWCSDAYFRCAGESIQIHGGVGFTWEYDPHLHFKRARCSQSLLGEPAWHRERVAQAIGI
jgi:alkylation response protein AidB-like acyl-CoA dehydrogenase